MGVRFRVRGRGVGHGDELDGRAVVCYRAGHDEGGVYPPPTTACRVVDVLDVLDRTRTRVDVRATRLDCEPVG